MASTKTSSVVSLIQDERVQHYSLNSPFDPRERYPELSYDFGIDPNNLIYSMVRELLRQLELDADHYGSSKWNPFDHLIKPGDSVVIKPNLAKHEHYLGEEGLLCTITHGSVLRPIIDYVYIALKGKGSIVVCDTPFEYSNFEKMCQITGIKKMVGYLKQKGYPIELIDLRRYITKFYAGTKTKRYEQNGDPCGYVVVDLINDSEFHELDSTVQNYHTLADHTVDHYDPFSKEIGATNKHHHAGKHEYLISKTVLNADVVISVPKLKTHGKAGVTLNLKNVIGIVPEKNYMPHHRPGNPPHGDAFSAPPPEKFVKNRFIRRKIARSIYWLQYIAGERVMKKIADLGRKLILDRFWPVKSEKKHIEWWDWYGNNTLWRTILDLNKILIYCDKNGVLKDTPQRKYFSMIDGIIGQEGQGPTMGVPKHTSLLLGGEDPVAVDTIATHIMGLDKEKIKAIAKTKKANRYLGTCEIDGIDVRSNIDYLPIHNFAPPRGWEILSHKKQN